MTSMSTAAKDYFTTDKVPTKVGESVKLTLNEMLDKKLVLCHSDPCDKNVMLDNQCYKLIDPDMMRLLPKEFDVQRLSYNVLIPAVS